MRLRGDLQRPVFPALVWKGNRRHERQDPVFMVVAYDIRNDRRRKKVLNTLKDYGWHVQYSVFECKLPKAKASEMQERVSGLIDPNKDNVRYYTICNDCIEKITIQGKGKIPPP